MTCSVRLLLAVPLLLAASCDTSDDPAVCVQPRLQTLNAMTVNALVFNKLTFNKMMTNGLDALGLRDGKIGSVVDLEVLRDPESRRVLEYTVSCALEPDQVVEVSLDDETYRFAGALGLAPQWGEPGGVCDDECRGWVSACLISRINAHGERVEISLRGGHDALVVDDAEAGRFDAIEAVYYGDVFSDPQTFSACVPEGGEGLTRVCGDDADCPIRNVGACEDVCSDEGCLDAGGHVHAQTITVYRDLDDAGCEPTFRRPGRVK